MMTPRRGWHILRPALGIMILAAMLSGIAGHVGLGQESGVEFRHYSLEEGLSQSTVTAMIEDRQGFFWMGTQDGLNKFDGYSFTVYRHSMNDPSSLSDNWISCIMEDRDGKLWVGTYNYGLNRFDPVTSTATSFLASPVGRNTISSNNITAIVQDAEGILWISTWGGGLNRYDPASGTFTSFRHDDAKPTTIASDKSRALYLDSRGVLWVGTWNGLDRFDRATGTFVHLTGTETPGSAPIGDHVTGLMEDADGYLWCGTADDGLNVIDTSRTFVRKLNPRSAGTSPPDRTEFLGSIVRGEDASMWIATFGSGVRRYRGRSDTFTTFTHDMNDPQSLASDHVYTVYSDRSGRIWIGTDGGGVSRYDRRSNKFPHYKSKRGLSSGLTHNNIRSLTVDSNGLLWIGTLGGGVNCFSREEGVTRTLRHDPANPASISSDNIFAVVEDRRGDLWIGTEGEGLNRVDRSTGRATRYLSDPGDSATLSNNTVMAILEDRSGRIWVGTYGGGLNRYDRETNRFTRITPYPLDPEGPQGNYVWEIHEDRQGRLWLGTWGAGLNCYDPDAHTNINYRQEKGSSAGLSHNTIWHIAETESGDLWIGTAGGLDFFDHARKTFTHYAEEDGLPNNVIYGILPDRRGNLWLSTVRGLARFNPATKKVESFDVNDGLQSNEFNQGAYSAFADGQLCFGGVNGLNIFDPDSIVGDTVIPNVAITGFRVFDRPILLRPDADGIPTVRISYEESFFSFEFVVLDVTAPARNRYAYRLEGFDPDWIECGSRRYAGYTNLDGGDYVFRVKGCNSDGVWNTLGASVRVSISPPYWKSWWFRIGMLLLVVGIGAEVYRRNIVRLRHEKRSQEQFSKRLIDFQERERKRIAGELHDSLGQNLLVMKNALTQCQDFASRSPEMSAHLEQLSELTLQSLNEVREISFDLHPHTLERLGLRKGIQSVVTKIGQTSQINFTTHLDDVDPYVSKEKQIHLFRIVQEALTNVVKHSAASGCDISMRIASDAIVVTIADDGKGIAGAQAAETDQLHHGFGLKGMSERARLLGGTLDVGGGPAGGTTVRFVLPIQGGTT